MKIVHEWLAELVEIPADVGQVAHEISLRGFEVAAVENGVIDFEITANRPDCLSHYGVAREASVIWPQESKPPAALNGRVDRTGGVDVTIEDPDLCPRYAAQVFDVQVGSSPDWLVRRIEAAGLRSINNIVDVTNYVMLEIGQPMHAFDLERLAGPRLAIRRGRTGETLRTLDGADRSLDPEMLVIADAERAVAIAGVMGGHDSEVGATTKRIVLESAYFQPASVRRTSKRLNLKTEASTRFERGGDVNAPPIGLRRAAELFAQIAAGTAHQAVDVYPSPKEPLQLTLRGDRVERVLGLPVPAADVRRILRGLGFVVAAEDRGRWRIVVPTFRPDVLREVDLIEEVGRHYGFDRIPLGFPPLDRPQARPDERIDRDRKARDVLTASGFSEAMTFAFIERTAAVPFSPGAEPVAITNPLSEKFAVLRPSLLPGLIDSCAHNRRRGLRDVRLFEIGSRFTAEGEQRAIGVAWTGESAPAHWSTRATWVDFFDIKGVAALLCQALRVSDLEFSESDAVFLVRGRSADVRSGGRPIGHVGLLHPSVVEPRGMPAGEELYAGEFDIDAIAAASTIEELRVEQLPRFPAIVRDISILVADVLPAAAVRGTIRASAPSTLESIAEFDRYQGQGVPEGRVSLSLRLTFRSPERTLTDDEVEAAMDAIVAALKNAHAAERR